MKKRNSITVAVLDLKFACEQVFFRSSHIIFLLEKMKIISHNNVYTCMNVHYNAGAGYKEVTLKNHGNNGLAILHGNLSS